MTMSHPRRGLAVKFVVTVIFAMLSAERPAYAATMRDYCVVPPSIASPAKPNVNIVMDYSGSMQLPAYISCTVSESYKNGSLQCGEGAAGSYDPSRTYYGYFSNDSYYNYGSSRFAAKTACTSANRIGTSGCISGNLLNWITTTRIDAVRKALVGGRTSSGNSVVLESEGAAFTITDSTLGCTFIVDAPSVGNRVLAIGDAPGKTCPLGTMTKGDIKIDAGAVAPSGILDRFYPLAADVEFTIFKTGDAGVIRAGKNPTKSSLVSAIGNEQPVGGTPTGEALWEAFDYFRQSDAHSYAANNDQIQSGNAGKDPFYSNGFPVACRKSFALLISDGAWNGAVDPVIPARAIRTEDLRNLTGHQQGAVYVIHAFGDNDPDAQSQGRNSLITTAIFGGFRDLGTGDGWPYPFSGSSENSSGICTGLGNTARSNIIVGGQTVCNSRAITYPLAGCSPGTWSAACGEWGRKSDGLPYNFFDAPDGFALEKALEQAFNSIVSGLASGSSASLVSNNTGSGAALLQAQFYPVRRFEGEEVTWTGELGSLWYYIDPFLNHASIREETGYSGGIHSLDLIEDHALTYDFDVVTGKTTVHRWADSAGNGLTLVPAGTVAPEDVGANWRAGAILRATSPANRKILTTINGTGSIDFSIANASSLAPYLADPEPENVISYIRGTDDPAGLYRSRSTTINGESQVWKLGDIISSSPRAQSPAPLNVYHLATPNGYGDRTYSDFIGSTSYQERKRVFVGANDGMLHAFNLGLLREKNSGSAKASLSGSGLGTETWAFIPQGALPYLKYLADPFYDHLYYVDGPLRLFDASIHPVADGACASESYWNCKRRTSVSGGAINLAETSWRTVLIAGMGIGGAVRPAASTCSTTDACVKTPADVPVGAGYSSYFAFDVTDDSGLPNFLWEFSGDPSAPGTLGYATSGPAVVRIGDKKNNGRWFAVFGSGPTGPVDRISRQFLGRSDQKLRLFVVDIATGHLVHTIDSDVEGKPLAENAFAGSLSGAVVDVDRWNSGSPGHYSDDVIYIGYVRQDGSGGWTKGGILRLSTKGNLDPKQWSVSRLIDDIGPVTTSIAKLQDRRNGAYWIYFGTGRFFYKTSDSIDSPDSQQALYGVREPCYLASNIFSPVCTAGVSKNDLADQTTNPAGVIGSLTGSPAGWMIDLDGADATGAKAERVITDPVAAHTGALFFTTFRPNGNPCGYGGDTYIWAVKYNTGGAPPAAAMQGKALVQASTGTLSEVSLSGDFQAKDGRRSTLGIPGMPPASQGLTILARPKPARKLLHVQER